MVRASALRRASQSAFRRGFLQETAFQTPESFAVLPFFDVQAANSGQRCFLTTLTSRFGGKLGDGPCPYGALVGVLWCAGTRDRRQTFGHMLLLGLAEIHVQGIPNFKNSIS